MSRWIRTRESARQKEAALMYKVVTAKQRKLNGPSKNKGRYSSSIKIKRRVIWIKSELIKQVRKMNINIT